MLCPIPFIEFILDIEKNIQKYYSENIHNENIQDHISIVNDNIININIFKDIYTGFTIHNLNDLAKHFEIEELKKNSKIKLLIAFNYIWMNNYNYGLSWRIIGIENKISEISTDI